MPKDVTKVGTLSTEISSYTATFTALGLTLIGEGWSNGEYSVHAIRTTGSALFGSPQRALTVKDAVNALAAALGIAPRSNHPLFP